MYTLQQETEEVQYWISFGEEDLCRVIAMTRSSLNLMELMESESNASYLRWQLKCMQYAIELQKHKKKSKPIS